MTSWAIAALLVVVMAASVEAWEFQYTETVGPTTKFTVSVPVSVSKLAAGMNGVAVKCGLRQSTSGQPNAAWTRVITRALDSSGSYAGTVTFNWNLVKGPSDVPDPAQMTAEQAMEATGVKNAVCTLDGLRTDGPADYPGRVMTTPTPVLEVSGNF